MAGARVLLHGVTLVITGPLILVLDHHGDRGAKRNSSLDTRLNRNKVCLIARGCDLALTRATARDLTSGRYYTASRAFRDMFALYTDLGLEDLLRDRNTRGEIVDDATYA